MVGRFLVEIKSHEPLEDDVEIDLLFEGAVGNVIKKRDQAALEEQDWRPAGATDVGVKPARFLIDETEVNQIVHPAKQMISRNEAVVNEVAKELLLALGLVAVHRVSLKMDNINLRILPLVQKRNEILYR